MPRTMQKGAVLEEPNSLLACVHTGQPGDTVTGHRLETPRSGTSPWAVVEGAQRSRGPPTGSRRFPGWRSTIAGDSGQRGGSSLGGEAACQREVGKLVEGGRHSTGQDGRHLGWRSGSHSRHALQKEEEADGTEILQVRAHQTGPRDCRRMTWRRLESDGVDAVRLLKGKSQVERKEGRNAVVWRADDLDIYFRRKQTNKESDGRLTAKFVARVVVDWLADRKSVV